MDRQTVEILLAYALRSTPQMSFLDAFLSILHRYLKRLNLAGNRFNFIPTPLEEARTLEYLCLDRNPISTIYFFPVLTRLKELSICYMPNLAIIAGNSLSQLTGLEILSIQHCPRLTRIDEFAIAYQVDESRT